MFVIVHLCLAAFSGFMAELLKSIIISTISEGKKTEKDEEIEQRK